MRTYSLSPDALFGVLLHAFKHPSSAVSGVLLGTAGDGAGGAVEVAEAVPICHSFVTLTPVLEAALAQVSMKVAEQIPENGEWGGAVRC